MATLCQDLEGTTESLQRPQRELNRIEWPDTGEVELLHHVIAQDVGRALNPALVEGQMRGGATQGIGWALYEELAHDEDGRLVTGSFLTYAIPVAEQVPEIDTLIVEVPAPDGPYGAKGIGEAPVVAAPAAVANATVSRQVRARFVTCHT